MELNKSFAILVIAVSFSLTNGNYHYENYKVYNFDGETAAEPYRKPWFLDEYSSPFDQKNGRISLPAVVSSKVDEQPAGPEVYENPAEAYFVASTKRVPNEDKNFKKSISPFYTLTDSDNDKYKSIVLKSGAPYCQEIKSSVPKKRYRRDAMTCYKCKDPKNGATYEQCSYTSQPEETSQVTEYVPLNKPSTTTLRYRRSNENPQNEPKHDQHDQHANNKPNFRFSDDYFTPAASHDVPKDYKKKMENCDKVVKDSMVCMVCKDPKTNEKYEQCSYTNQPKDKAYAYSKSSSFGDNPQDPDKYYEESKAPVKQNNKRAYETRREGEEAEESPETKDFRASNPEVEKYFEEQTAAIKARTPKYDEGFKEPEGSDKLESGYENVKDGSCKKIVKDTMVCTVCEDKKTGGNYEQCAYAYNPSDKVYQFSRQKKFGYPEEDDGAAAAEVSKKSSGYKESESDVSDDHEPVKYEYDQPSEKRENQEYLPFKLSEDDKDKSESEKISDDVKGNDDNCEKVKKDTMTCMVCKDPKTGGNYEQCSYAYEPNDKVFSYSKAKSFGSPEDSEDKESGRYNEESGGESPEGSYGLASNEKPYVAESSGFGGRNNPSNSGASAGVGDFFSTAEKKKEIEKVLSEFEQEDRSKCKKVIKDKLTCFQCTDKDGIQKEECIFVADQKPSKSDKVSYREVKKFKRDPVALTAADTKSSYNYYPTIRQFDVGEGRKPAAGAAVSKKQKRKTKKTVPAGVNYSYNEPLISASENEERTRNADDDDDDGRRHRHNSEVRQENEEAESADPYDYAAATKPTYDKVLGITLPRYMLQTSEHEIEFDEVVASSKI